jgi:hypothetical protein
VTSVPNTSSFTKGEAACLSNQSDSCSAHPTLTSDEQVLCIGLETAARPEDGYGRQQSLREGGRLPPEPDITGPPPAVSTEVARLDAALDQVVPPKAPGANIAVGTWNLRAFADLTKDWETPAGLSPKRNLADVTYIGRFIRRCDIVAVQEVRGNLRALRYMLKVLGDDWAFILTDVTQGPHGNDERLAFLFDTRRVKPSGLACELVVWIDTDSKEVTAGALDRQFARTPYAGGNDLLGGEPPRAILRWLDQIAARIQPIGARVVVNTIYDPSDGDNEVARRGSVWRGWPPSRSVGA